MKPLAELLSRMLPSQLACRLNRSDIGTHLFGRAPVPALTLCVNILLSIVGLFYCCARLSLIGRALAAHPDFGRHSPHETHRILTSASPGRSSTHPARRAEPCGHRDNPDGLWLHVQDHLVPPLVTGLRLESLEPFAG